MLVRNEKNAKTINLDRFDYTCATDKYVLAIRGSNTVEIAKCETEKAAKDLEKAIFEYWMSPNPACSTFGVDKWCMIKNVDFE